jgi:hypothetical protein
MAQKKITELQLIDDLTDSVNLAGDDGIQTYRTTMSQVKKATRVMPYAAKTSAYTVGADDHFITCDPSGGAFTISLPTEASVAGRCFIFKKTTSDFLPVTIEDDASSEVTTLNTIGETVKIMSDGTNWHVIDRYIPSYLGALTTVGSFTTNTTYTGLYWREKEFLIGDVKAVFSGAPNAANFTISPPGSLEADTSKVNNSFRNFWRESQCNVIDATNVVYFGRMEYQNETTFRGTVLDEISGATRYIGFDVVEEDVPITLANTDIIHCKYKVAIDGWKG